MADIVPAHLTVSYPEEVADGEPLLLQRAELCREQEPFVLRFGAVFAEEDGAGGVFVAVGDLEGGWARLRSTLLGPPLQPIDFPPHVTIAHPRTSNGSGPDCFAELRNRHAGGTMTVREFVFTETTAHSFTILRRFPLDGLAGTPAG